MGGNYGKSVYNQLMDVMEKLDAMESECKKSHKEIKSLNAEVKSLKNENARLKEELAAVKARNIILTAENAALRQENQLLRDDNERMKRILNNDSSNSGTPPSTDQPGKAPNVNNSRKPTKKKAGAQTGHRGSSVSKTDVEKKIQEGVMEHSVKEIGGFGDACADLRPVIENVIFNSREVCTDATVMTTNGVQTYIRNFSTKDDVLYCSCAKKDLETLSGIKILKEYAGTLIHDHETAAYYFGTRHGECNVHLQ